MVRTVGGMKKSAQLEIESRKRQLNEDPHEIDDRSSQSVPKAGKKIRMDQRSNGVNDVGPSGSTDKLEEDNKRRRVVELIRNGYKFAERYNTSFSLVIQVEGSSDIIVAGVGFALGTLRRRKQIRIVQFTPPKTKGKYTPSLEVCKNVKMNESLKPEEKKEKAGKKGEKEKAKKFKKRKRRPENNKELEKSSEIEKSSMTKNNVEVTQKDKTATDNQKSEFIQKQKKSETREKQNEKSELAQKQDKFEFQQKKNKRSELTQNQNNKSVATQNHKGKLNSGQSEPGPSTSARSEKASASKETWDASSETVGLEPRRNKLSKKKEKLELKMPSPATIERAKFQTPLTKSSKYAL